MLKLNMRLDGKITSVNKTYIHGRNGAVYLAPEVRAYREAVKPVIQEYYLKSGTKYEGGLIVVDIHVHTNFFTKAGEVRVLDIDNFAKNILDAVFPALEINDKTVFDLRLRKVQYDGTPFVTIKVKEVAHNAFKKKLGQK